MTTNAHFKFKLDIFPPLSISPCMSSIFLIYLPRNSDLLVSLADLKTKKQKEKKMKTLKTHLTTVVEFLSVAVE